MRDWALFRYHPLIKFKCSKKLANNQNPAFFLMACYITNWVQKDHTCQFGRAAYYESLKQICLGWIFQQPDRAKLGWDECSFAIGLCAGSVKITNVHE